MIYGKKTSHYRNLGLLILRVGLGIIFILHGYPKVSGGPEIWATVGTTFTFLGLDPTFFGFIAGVIELFGGIFLALGLFFRPALILMLIVMIAAVADNMDGGNGISGTSYSIELFIMFFSFFLIGAGRYSVDTILSDRQKSIY